MRLGKVYTKLIGPFWILAAAVPVGRQRQFRSDKVDFENLYRFDTTPHPVHLGISSESREPMRALRKVASTIVPVRYMEG